jgi:hypothetical protein
MAQRLLKTVHGWAVETGKSDKVIREALKDTKPDGFRGDKQPLYFLSTVIAAIEGVDQSLDANRERARKDKEHADKLALENARTRAESVATAQVVREVGDMLTAFRTRIVAIPDAIGQILDAATARTVVPAVRGKVYEALTEIADYRPGVSGEAGAADDAAADADGEPVGGSVPAPVQRKQRRVRAVEN